MQEEARDILPINLLQPAAAVEEEMRVEVQEVLEEAEMANSPALDASFKQRELPAIGSSNEDWLGPADSVVIQLEPTNAAPALSLSTLMVQMGWSEDQLDDADVEQQMMQTPVLRPPLLIPLSPSPPPPSVGRPSMELPPAFAPPRPLLQFESGMLSPITPAMATTQSQPSAVVTPAHAINLTRRVGPPPPLPPLRPPASSLRPSNFAASNDPQLPSIDAHLPESPNATLLLASLDEAGMYTQPLADVEQVAQGFFKDWPELSRAVPQQQQMERFQQLLDPLLPIGRFPQVISLEAALSTALSLSSIANIDHAQFLHMIQPAEYLRPENPAMFAPLPAVDDIGSAAMMSMSSSAGLSLTIPADIAPLGQVPNAGSDIAFGAPTQGVDLLPSDSPDMLAESAILPGASITLWHDAQPSAPDGLNPPAQLHRGAVRSRF